MSITRRIASRGTSRGASALLLLGLGSTTGGCALPFMGGATADTPAGQPTVGAAGAGGLPQQDSVDAIMIGADGKVTVLQDSEVEAVTRAATAQAAHFDEILRQRADARRQQPPANASAAETTPAPVASPVAVAVPPAAHDPAPAPAPAAPTPTPAIVQTQVASNSGVDSTADAQPTEPADPDFGDARRGSSGIAANLAGPLQVNITAAGTPAGGNPADPAPPSVGRSSSTDPMLLVTQGLEQRVGADPRNVSAHFDLQLARFLRDEPVPSLADLASLPAEDREMIAAIFDGLSNFRGILRDERNPLASAKARPLLEMADRIRARTDLTVSSVALCTAVRTYGNYDPIDPVRFAAGRENVFIFYCEVDGFLSQLAENQQWQTKLSLELRLYDDRETPLKVWEDKTVTVVDNARKHRRDFFINKRITLPRTLAPGRYLLKATVCDLQANRVAQHTTTLTLDAR